MEGEIDFDQIKRSISLSEVLLRHGIHVPPRSKYRIPCPIHGGDNWSSFAIDDEKGLYHCFKCEAGGDVVNLFAELEGITVIEAGKRLVSEFNIKSLGGSQSFQEAWNEVKKWEPKESMPIIELPPSEPLNGYRRFSKEAIDHYGLRLVPTGVLIPFKDENGRLVGYAVRQINLEPKYKNSTGLKKADILYGLYQNLDAIKRRRYVFICEGQFSAIRVWDYGCHNVVATLGADMSPTQARLLAPYVEKIIVLYDGDQKGMESAQKIKENYSSLYRVEIITLPDGQDPDTADLKVLIRNGE